MAYTKNQHVLSQWVLRNFRSDDTALSPKDKQRVWCHVVVPSADGENDIKDIPLPISSVAICKDCFRLKDGDTGDFFDISMNSVSMNRICPFLFVSLFSIINFLVWQIAIYMTFQWKNCLALLFYR